MPEDINKVNTARHVAQQAQKHARSKALSGEQIVKISAEARHGAMRAALAANKPLPSSEELSRLSHTALEAARDVATGVVK